MPDAVRAVMPPFRLEGSRDGKNADRRQNDADRERHHLGHIRAGRIKEFEAIEALPTLVEASERQARVPARRREVRSRFGLVCFAQGSDSSGANLRVPMHHGPIDREFSLLDAVKRAPDFAAWEHVDKIRLFCWHLQSNCDFGAVRPADVARCYDELKLEPPSSIGPFFDLLRRRQPTEMSKDADGCRLEARVLEEFDVAYGRDTAPRASDLEEIAEGVADARRRKYLDETLVCFRAGAYRAAVVMAWNLAREVLREQIVAAHAGRGADAATNSARSGSAKESADNDLKELTDRQLLTACEQAAVISKSDRHRLTRRLDECDVAVKLSAAAIMPAVAEDLVRSALEDVILRYK
jgi:hypothetical protein